MISAQAAAVALSALINALYETDCVAIVRRVYQANGQVKIGCLVPQIEADCECLVYNELPFAEDVRCYAFGSLPVAPSASAKQKSAPSGNLFSVVCLQSGADQVLSTFQKNN